MFFRELLDRRFQRCFATDTVEVTIDIELLKNTWMVWRATGFLQDCVAKAKRLQVQALDKSVDEADGVVFADIFIQGLRKEDELVPVQAFDVVHRSCS